MRRYRPILTSVGGAHEQSFTANVVHVDHTLVAFGDVVPDPARGLPYGTPVHSLLVHVSRGRPSRFELNDQGNTVRMDAVERIELARDQVRIVFRPGAGPASGRVSLSKEIELFEDDFESVTLGGLLVRFTTDDETFGLLKLLEPPLKR